MPLQPATSLPPAPPPPAWVVLRWLVAIAACLVFERHLDIAFSDKPPVHDEVISYLAATGHEGAYAARFPSGPPADRWAKASDWQSFWKPDTFGTWKTIRDDLNHYDIHPPLYFWVLHAWTYLFGSEEWSGRLLNVPLLLLGALLVYATCRALCAPRLESSATAVLWAGSLHAFAALGEARQYVLLALASAALVLATVRLLNEWSLPRLCAFAAAALVGVSVHYHFVLLAAPAAVFVLASLVRHGSARRTTTATGAAVVTLAAFVLVDPEFYLPLVRILGERAWTESAPRAGLSAINVLAFVLPFDVAEALVKGIGPTKVFSAVAGLALVAFVLGVRWVRRRSPRSGNVPLASLAPVGISLFAGAAVIGLYLGDFTPPHAMQPKYLLFVTAGLYVGFAQAVSALRRRRSAEPFALAVIILLLVVQGGLAAFSVFASGEEWRTPPAEHFAGHPTILDTVARGHLPQVLWSIPADTDIYAGSQERLARRLADPSFLRHVRDLTGLENDTLIYVSSLKHGNTSDGRARIVDLLQRDGFETVEAHPVASVLEERIMVRRRSDSR